MQINAVGVFGASSSALAASKPDPMSLLATR